MMARVSFSNEVMALEDAWDYYEICRNSLIRAEEQTKQSVLTGTTEQTSRFFAMSIREVEEFFAENLGETDRQVCFFLVACAEATLRLDFQERVNRRKKDDVSLAFRTIDRQSGGSQRNVRLDEDILETWAVQVPSAKSRIGQLRGALKYRNWLAHGRWWIPKLGQKYDPTYISMLITELFRELGLPTSWRQPLTAT